MTDALTPDMVERLNKLLDQANGFVGAPEAFARRALELGIGLIPTARRMFLIDQVVHEGVLWRLDRLRRQHPPKRVIPATVWKGLMT